MASTGYVVVDDEGNKVDDARSSVEADRRSAWLTKVTKRLHRGIPARDYRPS